MDIETKSRLFDILNAINEIESFMTDSENDFAAFQNDLKTRRAVERNIEIIGEAMNRILQRESTINLANARKIVDTRNRIIHGYDTVSDEFIWAIIVSNLPMLKVDVEKMLNE